MIVYYLTKEDTVASNDLQDIANLEQCEQDLDEAYDAWSWDEADMIELSNEIWIQEARATMEPEDFKLFVDKLERSI